VASTSTGPSQRLSNGARQPRVPSLSLGRSPSGRSALLLKAYSATRLGPTSGAGVGLLRARRASLGHRSKPHAADVAQLVLSEGLPEDEDEEEDAFRLPDIRSWLPTLSSPHDAEIFALALPALVR
jgi:hypothetical protein